MALVCLGLRGFLGCRNFNAKAETVLGKPGQLVTLTYNNVFFLSSNLLYCPPASCSPTSRRAMLLCFFFAPASLTYSHSTLKVWGGFHSAISCPFLPGSLTLRWFMFSSSCFSRGAWVRLSRESLLLLPTYSLFLILSSFCLPHALDTCNFNLSFLFRPVFCPSL